MLGGLGMLNKIVAGTLVLVILSTSGVVVYADPANEVNGEMKSQIEKIEINTEKKEEKIKIFSPKINSSKEVVTDKNLLISVQVLTDSSVTISVYKVLEESEELLFEPEVIKPQENLIYTKLIKDITPGNYRMLFQDDKKEQVIEPVEFTVKKANEVVDEEKNNPVSNLLEKSVTDLLKGK